MDDWLIWLQAKVGPITFGAMVGFFLQVIISRPSNLTVAAERAVAAMLMSAVFSRIGADIIQKMISIDRETAVSVAASLLALGGVELLRVVRGRLLRVAGEGKADE